MLGLVAAGFGGFGVGGLGGCAPRDVATGNLAAQSLVQLDVTYGRSVDATEAVKLDAEAHFVRYRVMKLGGGGSDAASVAALLGITSADDLPFGACRNADALVDATSTSAANLEVALLDAGPLTVRNDGAVETVLEPHHYPDIVPYVSGVVYGQTGAPAQAPAAQSRLEVEAGGGEDVGPFVAAATLEHGFPGLAVSGAGGALWLRWSAESAAQGVLVELRWAGARPGTVLCHAADDGALELRSIVPSASLANLDAAVAAGASAEVSVARTSQSPLAVPGAGTGHLFVTLRDTAAVPVR